MGDTIKNNTPKKTGHQWTWKDTLERIQYIDTIINQVVTGAILLDTALFAAFGALILVFYSPDSTIDSTIMIKRVLIIMTIGGLLINLALIKNLSRQEYVRRWYFSIFPDNLPLEPHEKWLKEDITTDYNMDLKLHKIEKCNTMIPYCKLGKLRPGFCETWIIILTLIAVAFGYLFWITLNI